MYIWGLVVAKGDYETIPSHMTDEAGARAFLVHKAPFQVSNLCDQTRGGLQVRTREPPDPLPLGLVRSIPERPSGTFTLLPFHSLAPDSLAAIPQCGSYSYLKMQPCRGWWLSWLGHCLVHQKVVGSIPGQGLYSGCGFKLQGIWEVTN